MTTYRFFSIKKC